MDDFLQVMLTHIDMKKLAKMVSNIARYARYVPIHADMDDILQGMLTHIDMKKLAKNGAQYCQICKICYNMSQYAIKRRTTVQCDM